MLPWPHQIAKQQTSIESCSLRQLHHLHSKLKRQTEQFEHSYHEKHKEYEYEEDHHAQVSSANVLVDVNLLILGTF